MFVPIIAVEHQQLQIAPSVLNDHRVGSTRALTLPVQVVAIQAIIVLGSVFSLVLCDEDQH
jgi:hypothetical protein